MSDTATFNDAPPLPAPKSGKQFITFDALPEDGPTVLTLVRSNFIKDYEQHKPDGTTAIFDAVELYWGAKIDGQFYWVKEWPKKLSAHEKSNYAKIVKAMTGALPEAGSRPSDFYGKAVMATIENENKVSKKGTAYTASRITGYAPVPKALVATITPLPELKDAFEAAIKAQQEKSQDNPY